MKTTVKKICLALLCAVLTVAPLASCDKTNTETDRDFSLSSLEAVDPNKIPASSKEFSDVPPGTYTVLCHVPSGDLLAISGESEDTVDREIYLRNAQLKDRYSIELKELTITGSTVDFVRNSTLSGLVRYDVASLTYGDAMLLTVSNSLCALSELGGYYQNREMFSEDLSVGGKQYIEDFNIFAPRLDGTYALALNRSLLKSDSLEESVALLVTGGEWTYDTVHSFMRGKGTMGLTDGGIDALWCGGGIGFYENGTDGVPAYKVLEGKAKDVYSALKIVKDEGYLESTEADGEDTFVKIAKKTLLTVGTVGQIRTAIEQGLDLAVLPMPKTEKADKYSSFVSPDALCTVVPAGDETKNSVAFALTGMLYEYDLDSALIRGFTALASESNLREGEIFDIISSSRTFDLPALYDVGGLYDYLDSSLRFYLLPDAFVEGINDRAQTAVVAIEIMREGYN